MCCTHVDFPDFAANFNILMKVKKSVQTSFACGWNQPIIPQKLNQILLLESERFGKPLVYVFSTAQTFIDAPTWWSPTMGSALTCASVCTREPKLV